MITRISIIPFDLGGAVDETVIEALDHEGFSELPLEETAKPLIGLKVSQWISNDNEAKTVLYVESRGFGVAVDKETHNAEFSNHKDVVNLLEQRWQLHKQVCEGSHPLAQKIENLRNQLTRRFGDTIRWSTWSGILYVFSFYVAEDADPSQLLKHRNALLGIAALSEPSKVGYGDLEFKTQNDEIAHNKVIERIQKLDPADLPPDVETSTEIYCGATWASLIVVGLSDKPTTTIRTYELLEVRTQIAWFVAYQVRRWCETTLAQWTEIKSSALDELRWQVLPLLLEVKQLSHASMSTRYSEILQTLRHTSRLEQEIEATEQALKWAYEIAERVERQKRHRYERAVEALLGVLAVLQLSTLIHEVPLVALSTQTASLILAGTAIGIALLVARNRSA